jgi:hypothetical protein
MSWPNWGKTLVGVFVVFLWKVLVLIAAKRLVHGITVVDVSSSQSRFRERFQNDVECVLSAAAAAMPRRTGGLRHRLRTFARADIENSLEYYRRERLLLFTLDYGDSNEDPKLAILEALVGFSILDRYAAKGIEATWHDERVQHLKRRYVPIIAARFAAAAAT